MRNTLFIMEFFSIVIIFIEGTLVIHGIQVRHACNWNGTMSCQPCDGHPDCFDVSDEKNCTQDVKSITKSVFDFFPPPPLPPFPLCNTMLTTTTPMPATERTPVTTPLVTASTATLPSTTPSSPTTLSILSGIADTTISSVSGTTPPYSTYTQWSKSPQYSTETTHNVFKTTNKIDEFSRLTLWDYCRRHFPANQFSFCVSHIRCFLGDCQWFWHGQMVHVPTTLPTTPTPTTTLSFIKTKSYWPEYNNHLLSFRPRQHAFHPSGPNGHSSNSRTDQFYWANIIPLMFDFK